MEAKNPVNHELIECVTQNSGIGPDKAEAAVRALVAFIETHHARGDAVLVPGLGKFAIEQLEGGEGRNPSTGAVIKIQAFNRPTFFPAKSLKDAVNK